MSEAWCGYKRGPQGSGANSPVPWSGLSGHKGPERRETGTWGCSSVISPFLLFLAFSFLPGFSSAWQLGAIGECASSK